MYDMGLLEVSITLDTHLHNVHGYFRYIQTREDRAVFSYYSEA